MSNRSVIYAKMSREAPGGRAGTKPLDRFFREQHLRDLRKRAQSQTVPPKGGIYWQGIAKKVAPFLRAAGRAGGAAAIAGVALEILRRAMPDAGAPYGNATIGPRPRNLVRVCPPFDWAGCVSYFTFQTLCLGGQAAAADGSCAPTGLINSSQPYAEFENYHVGPPINYRNGTKAIYSGNPTFPQLAENPALFPKVPKGGISPWIKNRTTLDEDADGGPGMDWQPEPHPFPQVAPESEPIGEPRPVPRPLPFWALPYRVPNPYAPDQTQPQWGPGSPTKPPLPWETPTTAPGKRLIGVPEPGNPRVVFPDKGPTLIADPTKPRPMEEAKPEHRFQKPSKRKLKERKVLAYDTVTRIALKLVNITTESCDAIDGFYDALPEKLRKQIHLERLQAYRKWKRAMAKRGSTDAEVERQGADEEANRPHVRVNCTEKARQLWKHWDKVDIRRALENLAENQLEDWAFGQAGKRTKKLARERSHRKMGIGYQTGGAITGKRIGGFGRSPWDGIFSGVLG